MTQNITIPHIILHSLLNNDEYVTKTLPYIQPEYFDQGFKDVFTSIQDYTNKYNSPPPLETVKAAVNDLDISTARLGACVDVINAVESINPNKSTNHTKWLLDVTEGWCRKQALNNAIMESYDIINKKNHKKTTDSIPNMLQEALAISFDTNIGHVYSKDYEKRWAYYQDIGSGNRTEFDIELMNIVTGGGLLNGTVFVTIAGTGVGKSLVMTHLSAHLKNMGKNVLYISMEMAAEQVAKRVDANLLNVDINSIDTMEKDHYLGRLKPIIEATQGEIVIKQFPTGTANSNHFRALVKELRMKNNFSPDVIMVDYLNICSSANVPPSMGSYANVKGIIEELRALSIEFDVPVITATQPTREGNAKDLSDMDLTQVSESKATADTADYVFAMISNEDMESSGKVLFKQLKNRYNSITENKRFEVGIDRSKMKLYNLIQTANSTGGDDTSGWQKPQFGGSDLTTKLDNFN